MTAGRGNAWAIGVGCRKGIAAEAVLSLLREVGADRCPAGSALFTIDRKRDEMGLTEAAKGLGLPLVHLAPDAIRAVPSQLYTASMAVNEAVGVPSVAEAAALAGAGAGAHLLRPKLSRDGVTCAIATAANGEQP